MLIAVLRTRGSAPTPSASGLEDESPLVRLLDLNLVGDAILPYLHCGEATKLASVARGSRAAVNAYGKLYAGFAISNAVGFDATLLAHCPLGGLHRQLRRARDRGLPPPPPEELRRAAGLHAGLHRLRVLGNEADCRAAVAARRRAHVAAGAACLARELLRLDHEDDAAGWADGGLELVAGGARPGYCAALVRAPLTGFGADQGGGFGRGCVMPGDRRGPGWWRAVW